MSDTGIVNIHGKQYKTVAKRVDEFRKKHNTTMSIITRLIESTDDFVVMKAEILDKDGRVIATGYAEEKRNASMINKTSALENCETSAIGRALANFGYAGGEYASADEVASAIKQQYDTPKPTQKQLDLIRKLAKEQGNSDDEIEAKIAKITTSKMASMTIDKLTGKG